MPLAETMARFHLCDFSNVTFYETTELFPYLQPLQRQHSRLV